MRARSLFFALAAAFLLSGSPGMAQTWEVFDTLTAGFPSNSVMDIAIDSQANVWVATNWGLCKYDGTSWQVFQEDNSGLPENTIQCLAIDTLDRLWIGTLMHGVVVYDGSDWTTFDHTNSGMPDDQVRSISIDHRNWAWVGTYVGLACYTGDAWRVYTDQPGSHGGLVLNGPVIEDVAVREDGLVAIGTLNGGFHYLTDTCVQVHTTFTDLFPDNTQVAVAFDPFSDQRWIATPSHGLVRHFDAWDAGLFFVYSTQTSNIPSNGLTSLAMDPIGRPWMGTNYAGICFRDPNGEFTTFNSSNSGLPDNTISNLVFAPDGSLWVGTFFGGAARLTFPTAISESTRGIGTVLELIPNPARDRVRVQWPPRHEGAPWRLLDITGRAVKHGQVGGLGPEEIDLSTVGTGLHVLELVGPQGPFTARLLVL